MVRLFSLHVSPWSEKARWALDHHRIAYELVEHVPMLGEPRLRLAAGRLLGKVTVPLLVDGDLVVGDSLEIARHADRVGAGATLFPVGEEAAITRFSDLSNELMTVARGRVLARTIADREAQRESLPRALPDLLAPMAATGAAFLARKYGARDEGAVGDAKMRRLLEEVRAALGERETLLSSFSYADIALAASLQILSPVADRHWRLGPATRRVWGNAALSVDFGDLLRWRDTVYDRHRRPTLPVARELAAAAAVAPACAHDRSSLRSSCSRRALLRPPHPTRRRSPPRPPPRQRARRDRSSRLTTRAFGASARWWDAFPARPIRCRAPASPPTAPAS